ncbi:hypothetical protein Ocin01_00100, partial [Orchesella cincta]
MNSFASGEPKVGDMIVDESVESINHDIMERRKVPPLAEFPLPG